MNIDTLEFIRGILVGVVGYFSVIAVVCLAIHYLNRSDK